MAAASGGFPVGRTDGNRRRGGIAKSGGFEQPAE